METQLLSADWLEGERRSSLLHFKRTAFNSGAEVKFWVLVCSEKFPKPS